MPRLSKRAGKNRLAVIAGLSAVIVAYWILVRSPGVELVGEKLVKATVVETVLANNNTPGDDGMTVVVVALDDGGKARIFAPRAKASVGTPLAVIVKQFSDGSRRIVAANSAHGTQPR